MGMVEADWLVAKSEREIASGGNDPANNNYLRGQILVGKELQRLYARLIKRYCDGPEG